MFRKLRNKLILINLGITSIVILTVFSTIYIFSTRSANERLPVPDNSFGIMTDDFQDFLNISIQNEKQAAARDLLIMLIVSGIAIELVVALISYYLAEEAIKPVREAYDSQKVFIANASHEIKTPLAAISANLEAADIKGNHWIDNIEYETEKLTTLNNELLNLARTDLISEPTLEEVDLKNAINKMVKSFEPRLDGINFDYKNSVNDKMRIAITDFTQIVNIMMDNAIKYSDHVITLVVSNHELIICNDGAKIKPKDLEHVFERFYQADKSSEGVGLGLSIAKALAERNQWKLTAESDKLTIFKLLF